MGHSVDPEAEAARFLERDFTECFSQMRHYDGQIWAICKFTFTAYTALLGVAIGLYQYSIDKQFNLAPAAMATLGVGVLLGVVFLSLVVRNRVYFVVVARYINEHRAFFLKHRPLGFENASRMYTNLSQPPFFNWRSSQAGLLYTIAALNSVLLGVLTFIGLSSREYRWTAAVGVFLGFSALQLVAAISYLRSREKKSASRAVFGQD